MSRQVKRSAVKEYLTTAQAGKNYRVKHYNQEDASGMGMSPNHRTSNQDARRQEIMQNAGKDRVFYSKRWGGP